MLEMLQNLGPEDVDKHYVGCTTMFELFILKRKMIIHNLDSL